MKLRILMGLTCASLGLAGVAMAETSATIPAAVAAAHDMAGMAMPAMPQVAVTSSTAAYMDVDAKMHQAMMVHYTGDADVDFLRAMIPHHQGAVDMANVVLKYGSDPDVRMLAGDIVKAQEKEIKWMQDWLAKHGPKDAQTAIPVSGNGSSADVQIPLNMIPKGMTPVAGKVERVATTAKTTVKDTVSGAVKTIVSTTTVIESSTVPAMDVSGSTALMMDGMPMSMTPEMPAANEAIPNEAPEMHLLEQPVKK